MRTARSRPPLPPAQIEGTITADLGDVAHLAWLAERGFVLAATTDANPALTRAACGLAAAAFWRLLPAALTLQTALTARPGSPLQPHAEGHFTQADPVSGSLTRTDKYNSYVYAAGVRSAGRWGANIYGGYGSYNNFRNR